MGATVCAICNQKGGVAKTQTAVSLGIGLARKGRRVLLVDLDAQGSMTASLGYRQPDQMEVTLVNAMSRETVLRSLLAGVRGDYDEIILDCSPSLGMLTINALAASDQIVIPVLAQYLSIKGMEQLIRTIAKVKRQINPGLSIAGILITMADMRTNYAKEIVELLHGIYDGKLRIFGSVIPLSVRAAETSAEGKSICLHDPSGKVAAAYGAFTEEVMGLWAAGR